MSAPTGDTARADRVTRAPSDVLRLGVATTLLALVVLIGWLFDRTIVDNVASAMRGLDTIAASAVALAASCGEILTIVLIGGGLVVAVVRREWLLVGSSLAAGALAVGLVLVLDHLFEAQVQVTRVDQSLTVLDPDSLATAAGLAALTGFVTAASPWVSRRWRRAAWATVIVLTVVRLVAADVSFETVVALLAGWTAGAAAVVAFGAPSRRPTPAAIAAGLGAVGVPLARIDPLSVDARGSTPYLADDRDGRRLFVKALGADERSADLMFRVYRRIQPRDLGDERAFSSLRRMVEHEALVALTARDLGVRTPRFVAFATAAPNGFVLAYEAIAGRSLDRLEPEEMTDDLLAATWAQLAIMRTHRIAHRDLRLANVFFGDDGLVWIIDFGFAELSASDVLLKNDVAELLASSTTRVGADRAVDAAVAAIGRGAVAGALDRLQLPMLAGATRESMKAAPNLLAELRGLVEAVASGARTITPTGG